MHRPRPWFRRLRTLAICLLLGVVLTVAVAWGLSLTVQFTSSRSISGRPTFVESNDGVFDYAQESRSGGVRMREWMRFAPDQQEAGNPLVRELEDWAEEFDAGWPALALGWQADGMSEGGNVRSGALRIPEWRSNPIRGFQWTTQTNDTPSERFRLVPTRPTMPGFALDALFWGSVSWLLFFAPFTLRRALRARRGRCPACGYDMRGLDACPECGDEA